VLFTVAGKLLPESAVRWAALVAAWSLFFLFVKSRRAILTESAGRFFSVLRVGVFGFAALLFLRGTILAAAQYLFWRQVNPALLPPYQPLSYFVGYAWTHFGKEAVFSVAFAGLLLLTMAAGNRFSGGRFFYREEPWLAAFGVLAAPWPAGLVVMMSALTAGVLAQVILTLLGQRMRVPLVWFWFPSIFLALFFGDIIGGWIGLTSLKI
jgi:hypothetical protein